MFFGLFRYFLVALVVLAHIGPRAHYSVYAVFNFYTLAGYFSVLTLNNVYGWSWQGKRKYLTNRFFRIYPIYFVVLVFSFVVVYFFPEISKNLNPVLMIPSSIIGWLKNIFIIGLGPIFNSTKGTVRLVPPVWYISNLLILYILNLFLGRNKKTALLWFDVSLFICFYYILTNVSFDIRYFPLQSASLPFSLGVVAYYFLNNNKIIKKYFRSILFFSLFLYIANLLGARHIDSAYRGAFYINMLLGSLIIVCLYKLKKSDFSSLMVKTDKLAGAMSYPIFLAHYPIAVIIIYYLWNSVIPEEHSYYRLVLFLLTFVFISLFSVLLVKFVEEKLQRTREKLRK